MGNFQVGVIVDSFRKGPREGVKKAKAVGADGIQVYAVRGEMAPENLDAKAREEFRSFVAGEGLDISALCGDLGGHGFERADENVEKVKKSKAIVDLAVDLGTNVVTTHIGVVPEDSASETYAVMRAALHELGEYAAGKGVAFAIETGPEVAPVLKDFLDAVDSAGIGVNLDPANFAMVSRQDPAEAVKLLGPKIVHTHAKDGKNYQPCDPEEIYHSFADGTFGKIVEERGKLFEEVPLGDGDVDWDAYLAALSGAGFSGFLTIEREVGDDPEADIRKAVSFLRERIG
jgi:L-ribulose-5-phosphate 3-epimerase